MKEYIEEKKGLTPLLAAEEAARCLLCLDAPCSKACPANTDPAKFIRSLRFRNLEGAIDTIRINNPMGAICARVCPTEKYCQQGCIRAGLDKPIDIGGLQRFLTDYEDAIGYKAIEPSNEKKDRVAIIGSGPAGLSAANILAREGYQVTIFEKRKRAGGYLTYGIPPYRLPLSVVDKEIKHTLDLGVKIVYDHAFLTDVSFGSLKVEGFKAVILATGYDMGLSLPIFKDNPYVETAVEFLDRVKISEGKVALPSSLLIIGGGDVAMDVAVTAKKLAVKSVTAVARETMDVFPSSKEEYDLAIANKVSIISGFTPVEAIGNKVVFKEVDGEGKLELQAPKIILAVGQGPSSYDPDLAVDRRDLVVNNYMTNLDGVFACGDITEGDKTVVHAVKKGKEAALAVIQYLSGGAK